MHATSSLSALLTAILILLSSLVKAQHCVLMDAKTQEPIPYANLYIPKLGTGTVSGPQGQIILSPLLEKADPEILATISCVGFAERSIRLGELQGAKDGCTVQMEASTYDLPMAQVKDRRYSSKVRQLGFRKDKSQVVSTYTADTSAVGTEVGNVMSTDKPWLLQGIGTNVEVDTATIMEVNIYSYAEDGSIGERLHNERILLEVEVSSNKKEVVELDLSQYNISGEGDFLVTLEVVGPLVPTGRSTYYEVPRFNSRIALGNRQRITRYRRADGQWARVPLGLVIGIWANVREAE